MSSDNFDVRVIKVDGAEVVFDVLTGTNGGYDDCFTSRSFALSLLHDALCRAPDMLPGPYDDTRASIVRALQAGHDAAPLTRALAGQNDWYVNAAWMRENVGRFIAETTLVERRNNIGEEALIAVESEISEAFGGELRNDRYDQWGAMRWARSHNYTLRVLATDPQWTSHISEGLLFTTTAFDVWDDKSPAPAPLKKPAKRPASKKAAAKKPAAKKPVAKKSAKGSTKKAASKKPAKKASAKRSAKKPSKKPARKRVTKPKRLTSKRRARKPAR